MQPNKQHNQQEQRGVSRTHRWPPENMPHHDAPPYKVPYYDEFYNTRNIISPFNDQLTLEQVKKTLQIMKKHGTVQQQFRERFMAFEQNLNGVLQRKTIQHGSNERQQSYYAIIAELQRKLIVEQARRNNLQSKCKSLQQDIYQKDKRIRELQNENDQYRKRDYNNQILIDLFKGLKKADSNRPPNYNSFFEDIDRQLKIYDQKFKNFLNPIKDKNLKVSVEFTKIKASLVSFVQKMDQLRKRNQLDVDSLKSSTAAFLTVLENSIMRPQFEACMKVHHMKTQMQVVFSVLESYFFKVRIGEAGFKDRFVQLYKQFQNLRQRCQRRDAKFFEFKGWVDGSSSNRTVKQFFSDEENKHFLTILGVELKRVFQRYPSLKDQVNPTTLDIINLDFISEAVYSESLIRIKQIVHKDPFLVRVEDVYRYDSTEERKKTFHLRILIKSLLQQLHRISEQIKKRAISGLEIQLDAGIMELIRGQIIEGVDVQSIYALFRPMPKVVQVEHIVQRLVVQKKEFTKHYPVKVQEAKVVQTTVQKGVDVIREEPIEIERAIGVPISQPFIIENKVEIPLIKTDVMQVQAEKVAIAKSHSQMIQQKLVREHIVKEVPKQILVQVPKEYQVEKIIIQQVAVHDKDPVEVYGQREVPLWRGYQTIQKIKEVPITRTQIVEVLKYKEIKVIEQKPIATEIIKPVECHIEKPIFTQVQRLIEVPCRREVICEHRTQRDAEPVYVEIKVPTDKQIPKELIVQTCDFVIGQTEIRYQPAIKIVQRMPYNVQKMMKVQDIIKQPVIRDIIQERVVPIEVLVPYGVPQPFPVKNSIYYPVPVNVEVPVEVIKETAVPIYINNVIIQKKTQCIEKIVKQIVQIPVIHEVQKIVEKIVVIPTIVRQIIEHPVFIEVIVEVPVQVLHIAKITEKVPTIIHTETIVNSKQLHIVEVPMKVSEQKIRERLVVEKRIETVPQIVTIENFINQEVRVEVPVEYIREVIVQKPVEVPVDRIRTKEVCVPFTDYKIAMQDKPVPIQERIFAPYPVHLIVQKCVPVYTYEERIHQVEKQKIVPFKQQYPVQCIKQVIVREPFIQKVNVPVEKVVPVLHIIEDTQIEYLYDTKPSVYENNKAVYLNKQVPINKPVQIPYKEEVPFSSIHTYGYQRPTQRTIIENRIWEIINIVELQGQKNQFMGYETKYETVEVPARQVIVQVKHQVPVNIQRNIPIHKEIVKQVKIPGPPKIVIDELIEQKIVQKDCYKQKIVEKFILLQQVHQVAKTIHEIVEVRNPNSGVEIDVMRQLHIELEKLLIRFSQLKGGNVPQNILKMIEQYMKRIGQWISSNPKIVETIKQIESRAKPVVIESRNEDREIALTEIIKRLVTILSENRRGIEIPRQIEWLFMYQLNANNLANESDFINYFHNIKKSWDSLGHWRSNHLVMLHSFLAQRLAYSDVLGRVRENWNHLQQLFLGLLEENDRFQARYYDLLRTYQELLSIFEKAKTKEHLEELIVSHKRFGDGDTDFGQGDRGGDDDPDNGGFPGGSYRSPRVMQSRYTSVFNSALRSKQRGAFGAELVNSEIYDASKIELLKSRYSIIEKDRSNLQMRCQQLEQGLLYSKNLLEGLDADGKLRQNEMLKIQLMNKINSLEQDNSRLRREYQEIQNRRVGTQQGGSQQSIQRAKQQVIDQYQRKIRSMEEAHKKQLQRQRNEYQTALKKSQVSGGKVSQNIETVKKQLNDDFDRRLRKIEDDHKNQIERIRTEHQVALKQSQTQSARGSKEGTELQKENKKLGDKIKILELEIMTLRRQLQEPQYEVVQTRTITHTYEQPESRIISGTGKSGSKKFERSAIQYEKSPTESARRFEREEVQSTSSKEGSISFEGFKNFKATMTLKVFSDAIPPEDLITNVMLKVIDAFQQQNDKEIFNCYSPTNIYIKNFNPSSLQSMFIKFGAPVLNKKNRKDGCYIAPQVHAGSQITSKSIVFSLGVIWDELIHKQLFFNTIAEVQNAQVHYQVRNGQISPIIKNLLVDMLSKDIQERLELPAVRKRLALQKYVSGSGK